MSPATTYQAGRVHSKQGGVDYFDINTWHELGEAVANYKKKGDGVIVEGRLQYRSWEAQDGSKRSKVDVVAENVQFLGNGKSTSGGSSSAGETEEEDFKDIEPPL